VDDWGPTGPELRAFIAKASGVAPEQAAALAASFNGFGVAYDNAAEAGHTNRPQAYNAARKCAPKDLPQEARLAIMNAAGAVAVRDLIEPQDFEELYGPWREVMEGGTRVAKREPEAATEAQAVVLPRVGPWRPPEGANPALARFEWPLEQWRQWEWGLPSGDEGEVTDAELEKLANELDRVARRGDLDRIADITHDAIDRGLVGLAAAGVAALGVAPALLYPAVSALFRPMP
jgi:hypothetical protein